MLTAADGRTDGRKLEYLTRPDRYRHFDPELYDWLTSTVHREQDRRTARIEASNLLGDARFHSSPLEDDRTARDAWFNGCRQRLRGSDLVFFDPDNGMERSMRPGQRDSRKFLYWSEIREMFAEGPSILIYQHFPREKRNEFIARLAERLSSASGSTTISTFQTPHVVFLLAAQRRHADVLRAAANGLGHAWPPGEILPTHHA